MPNKTIAVAIPTIDRLFTEGKILAVGDWLALAGYDPLFIPDGACASFGELPETTKNELSHRARALAAFSAWWPASSPGCP